MSKENISRRWKWIEFLFYLSGIIGNQESYQNISNDHNICTVMPYFHLAPQILPPYKLTDMMVYKFLKIRTLRATVSVFN